MKLTAQNIQFIDNYLQKADVIFADIRSEMTDHIASAVEAEMQAGSLDFYDAFKNYMVVNKKEILKGNKSGMGISLSVFRKFGWFLLRPQMIAFAILIFAVLTFLFQKTDGGFLLNRNFLILATLMIGVFQVVYFYIILKKRFYYVEKSGMILFVIYYCYMLFFQPAGVDETANPYILEVFIYLILAYFLFFIVETRNFLKFRYKLI